MGGRLAVEGHEFGERIVVAIDHFRSYVSNATVARVCDAWKNIRSEPVPFSYWRWHGVPVPVRGADSPDWLKFCRQTRDYMEGGGVLVIIGSSRAGTVCLIEGLRPLRIVDNSGSGSKRNAPVPREDIPPDLFAIDRTDAHARHDIVRLINDMRAANRGFAMVFQRPESFRDHEIGPDLANQRVLFIELRDKAVPA